MSPRQSVFGGSDERQFLVFVNFPACVFRYFCDYFDYGYYNVYTRNGHVEEKSLSAENIGSGESHIPADIFA